MTRRTLRSAVVAAALLFAAPTVAQTLDLPAASPRATVSQTVGVTPITVDYASPGVKGRTVYGELVPFGTLWRTGANAATTIEFGTDVKVAGQAVPAGKYAVFTIPGKDKWTVILNKNPNQGGTRSYDQKLDAVRFEAKPEKSPARERMTFVFSDTTDTGTRLDLDWAGTRVAIPITVETAALVGKGIDGYTKGTARTLANAARYHKDAGNLDRALALIDDALAVDETWFALWIKADTLAAKGDIKAAYPIAERAYALGQKDEYFFWKDQIQKALEDWKSKR